MRPLLISSVLLVFAGSAAAASESLDVKTGLWEVTYTIGTEGALVPKATLDALSPEQRAKVVAAANARAAKGPQTHVQKTCVTAEDLKGGAFRSDEDEEDKSCKFSSGVHTSTVQEESVVCSGEDGRRGTFKVEALDRERMKAAYNGEAGSGKFSMQMTGKWLGASCAGADDD
jgi:hypothetical protein